MKYKIALITLCYALSAGCDQTQGLARNIENKSYPDKMHFSLPELPYALNALEPYISAEIMNLHYNKHHKAYVDNLNAALIDYQKAAETKDLAKMIEIDKKIAFNGGGFINHAIFWTNLSPKDKGGGKLSDGKLKDDIVREFGSLDNLIKEMTTKTAAIQGSGWGWLGYDKKNDRLVITTSKDQDILNLQGYTPLLAIDIWEHAYYLQYKNSRADYLESIWEIINWKNVSDRYEAAKEVNNAKSN